MSTEGGRRSKKIQKLVNVVCEQPLVVKLTAAERERKQEGGPPPPLHLN